MKPEQFQNPSGQVIEVQHDDGPYWASRLYEPAEYTLEYTVYGGVDVPITDIPAVGTRDAVLTLSWGDSGRDLGLLLRGPSGQEIASAMAVDTGGSQTLEVAELGGGAYTVSVVSLDDVSGSTDFELDYTWREPMSRDEVDGLVATATSTPALFDFRARDGVRHAVWRVSADLQGPLRRALRSVTCAYVAAGHHRAESASRVRQILRGEDPDHDGMEEYNRFLAVLFPASRLRILPYNRAVRGLNGHTPDRFLDWLRQRFRPSEHAFTAADPSPGHIPQIIEAIKTEPLHPTLAQLGSPVHRYR